MSDDITPASVMTAFWRWIGVVLFGIGAVSVAVVVLWQAGWLFSNANTNREAHQIRNGYSNQQALREQITQRIQEVGQETVSIAQAAGDPATVGALQDQRIDTVNTACQAAGEVAGDPLPASQQDWVRANCQAGVIRPGSKYDNDNGGTQ